MSANRKISVTGLGYVGLTIATAFSESADVLGFDIDKTRIEELKKGHDRNGQLSEEQLKESKLKYTSDPAALKLADFHIISVPTLLDSSKQPDLSILFSATKTVAQQLKVGDIVVYESSVYPGVTEDSCIPLLEERSGLRCGVDFGVGFSPERVNPSDLKHTLANVPKIVSATDKETLDVMAETYRLVVKIPNGIHPVSRIRVAEATKLLENTQRDVNIAFMNEMAMILHELGIDTAEVLDAAKTKWNFLNFEPGLVGGHCIGVNTYYLAHKSEEEGYYPDSLLTDRRVNEVLPKFIADETIAELIHLGKTIKGARVAILGITYKEDCADFRDSKVIDVIHELQKSEVEIFIHDPVVKDIPAVEKYYDITLSNLDSITDMDAVLIMLANQAYVQLEPSIFEKMLRLPGVIMDIKRILNYKDFAHTNITLWKL